MKTKCSNHASVLSLAIAAAGLVLALWPATGQCQRSRRQASEAVAAADPNAAAQPNSWAGFDIILKRNIFSRQRRPARQEIQREERPRVMPNPESYYLLKGVVQENDDFLAFIEDTQSGTVLRLRRGDPVARGAIKTLTLDGLEYQREDKTTVVHMGRDLEGGQGNLTTRQMLDLAATPTSPTPASSSTQAAPAAAPSGADSDIIKRLMEQRKQQLGQ
jgi:hypothetical protein